MNAAAPGESVSKTAYAALIGVSPGRISQYISEGKLTADALDGDGRSAKILVAVANQQLGKRLDPRQRFGLNGLGTNLDAGEGESNSPAAEVKAVAPRDPFAEAMQREKLLEIQLRNQRMREDEQARRGVLVPTSEARAAMVGVAAAVVSSLEGSLPDIAQAMAEAFALPVRDVLHVLRTQFRAARAKGAEAARRRAQATPALVKHDDPAEPPPSIQ